MLREADAVLRTYELPAVEVGGSVSLSPGACLVAFGVPAERTSLLLTMGRLAPGRGFVVFDPDQIEVRADGLWLRRGLTADALGNVRLVDVSPPARVTGVINLFTRTTVQHFENPEYDALADRFLALEAAATCPISGGSFLEHVTNDKLHTRLLAASAGVRVPRCQGWCLDLPRYADHSKRDDVTLHILRRDLSDAEIEMIVDDIPWEKFVIKPSGPTFMGSRLVHIGDRDHLEAAQAAFRACLNALQDGDTILIDERVGGPVLPGTRLGARLRVYVSRRPGGEAEVSGVYANLGPFDKPIGGDHSDVVELSTLLDWARIDHHEAQRLTDSIRVAGARILDAITRYEEELEGRPENHGTELIGLDVFLHPTPERLEPVLIEVNDQDCTLMVQAWDAQHAPTRSRALDPWVRRMMRRSLAWQLSQRTVLVVGGGGLSKKIVFEMAERVGLTLVLVDPDPDHWARPLAQHFLAHDFSDHAEDPAHADAIAARLGEAGLKVDGCLTFWEDNAPLTAMLCQRLGTSGNAPEASATAKSKVLTHAALKAEEVRVHVPPKYHGLDIPTWRVRDAEELAAVPDEAYPIFLKYDTGSSAFGVERFLDRESALERWPSYLEEIIASEHDGVGLGYERVFLVQPQAVGTEHDVDLVLQDGWLVTAFVTDNGPIGPRFARELTSAMPSLLRPELQQTIIRSAVRACRAVGLTQGPINVELIHTPRGVKILEINGRMGGFYISRWLSEIFDVELSLLAYGIACGLYVFAPSAPTPRYQYLGMHLFPSVHGDRVSLDDLRRLAEEDPAAQVYIMEHELPEEHETYEEPYAAIGVRAPTPAEARRKMTALVHRLGIWDPSVAFVADALPH